MFRKINLPATIFFRNTGPVIYPHYDLIVTNIV